MVVVGDEFQGLFFFGLLESIVVVWIFSILVYFNQCYLKIYLVFLIGFFGMMIDGVLEGVLSVVFVDGLLVYLGLEGLLVFFEEMMIVVFYGYVFIICVSEVNGVNVYVFCVNCFYCWYFESWFYVDRVILGRIYEMEFYYGMLVCVIVGVGLVLILCSMLESMFGYQQVFVWLLVEEWCWFIIWLVWCWGVKICQLEVFIVLLNEDW